MGGVAVYCVDRKEPEGRQRWRKFGVRREHKGLPPAGYLEGWTLPCKVEQGHANGPGLELGIFRAWILSCPLELYDYCICSPRVRHSSLS